MADNDSHQRIFLGWERPFLDSASEWLLSQANKTTHIDLSHLSIISTVGRAARHLIEKLVLAAEKAGIGLSPPNIISISGLYESLLPEKTLVSPLDSELIFFSILKSCDLQALEALFPNLKASTSDLKLFEKARFLKSTYQEFTKNGLPASESIRIMLDSELITDEERWQALDRVFELYQDRLQDLNLLDSQSAMALLEEQVLPKQSSLVLLATYDLTPILKNSLKAAYSNLTALIFAPVSESQGFDEIGCIIPSHWSNRATAFNPDSVKVCKTSRDQALQLFGSISQIEENIYASQITVGALEPGMDRVVEVLGNRHELTIHLPNKISLGSSEPALVLLRSLEFITSKRFSDLAALLTLKPVYNKLAQAGRALEIVNNYREDHLQPLVVESLPSCDLEISEILNSITKLTASLDKSSDILSNWVSAATAILINIFDAAASTELKAVLEKLNSLTSNLADVKINADIFHDLINVSFAEVSTSEGNGETKLSEGDSIDVVGWLELALDDAPYTFILSFNESFVPAIATQNSFLPNKARTKIGLEDNDYRLARDAYVLETMLSSKEHLAIFASKSSLEGGPLLPSRLALRDQSDKLANTIINYFSSSLDSDHELLNSYGEGFKYAYANNLLPSKKPTSVTPKVSVTAIGDYLTCPYLYYLKHILKLESANPNSRELSALQFGSLIHDLIASFGNSSLSTETSSEKILNYLLSQLQERFEILFGKNPFAEVLVQYHQIESRLRNFADWQANWRAEGWQIHKVELAFNKPGFEIKTSSGDGLLTGRIDRIDFNPATSEYAILDFKSGDSSANPQNAFSKSKGWLDVQLPAYLFYASEVLELQNIKVALVPVSASTEALTAKWAQWDDSQIELAWEAITSSIKGIIEQNFWPPKITSEQAWDFKSIYRAHL